MTVVERDRLVWLREQIEQGWHVQAPVIQRVAYHGPNGGMSAFEFVLRRDSGCQVVAVPDCPELHRFLQEHALPTIAL